MDFVFENFQILLVIGLALAAWLKNRGDTAEEEEAERQAREEMIRHMQEVEERPIRKTPPPVPQQWDTRPVDNPQPTAQSQGPTPALKDIFQELVDRVDPTPVPVPTSNAYDEEPAPWDFEHEDASHSEITDTHDSDPPVLDRQRKMQQRIAELRRQAEEAKGQVGGARETQRRASGQSRGEIADLPPIAEVLKDRSQTRRAIILNEILSKPIGLRGAN